MTAFAGPLVAAALLAWVARRHPRWPWWRTAAGAAGLVALGVAGALGGPGSERLSVHVVEHGLITMLAAPLLALSAPARLALGTLPRGGRRSLARMLRSRPAHALAHPAAGVAIFTLVVLGAHAPGVVALTARSGLAHAAEHAVLLWAGLALWVPLIGADPLPRRAGAITRLAALLVAMTAMAALGAALSAATGPVYAAYPDLEDQRFAGGLLWEGGMVLMVPAILACAWAALATEERRQRARDLHGVRG